PAGGGASPRGIPSPRFATPSCTTWHLLINSAKVSARGIGTRRKTGPPPRGASSGSRWRFLPGALLVQPPSLDPAIDHAPVPCRAEHVVAARHRHVPLGHPLAEVLDRQPRQRREPPNPHQRPRVRRLVINLRGRLELRERLLLDV